MPNFIKIGQTVAEIWRFNCFQNGGCPPSWIWEIQIFLTVWAVKRAILRIYAKFREDLPIRCCDIAIFVVFAVNVPRVKKKTDTTLTDNFSSNHTPKCWTVSHLAKTTSWLLRSTVVYLIDLSTGGNYTLNIQTTHPFLRPTLQSVQCVGLLQWCTVFKAVNVLVHLCVICKRISTVSQLKWRQNSNL